MTSVEVKPNHPLFEEANKKREELIERIANYD